MANKLLFDVVDEQVAVGFTGKINILDSISGQIYGQISLFEGEVLNVKFKNVGGVKGFYNLLVAESEQENFKYVVEPEIISSKDKNIHFPLSVLKSKANDILKNYQLSKANRPPNNIKLLINPEFISGSEEVSANEYDLLATIADFSKIEDIYQHCSLLDYEITNALVSLRRKKALKVIQLK